MVFMDFALSINPCERIEINANKELSVVMMRDICVLWYLEDYQRRSSECVRRDIHGHGDSRGQCGSPSLSTFTILKYTVALLDVSRLLCRSRIIMYLTGPARDGRAPLSAMAMTESCR